MGKSKQICNNNDNSKLNKVLQNKEDIMNRLVELSDEEIDKLFEMGKITQSQYETILEFRKKKKKKKTEKERFEERIRCNNGIIQKIVNLGRKFRRQEVEYEQYQESLRNKEKILNRDERIRSGSGKARNKERTHDR